MTPKRRLLTLIFACLCKCYFTVIYCTIYCTTLFIVLYALCRLFLTDLCGRNRQILKPLEFRSLSPDLCTQGFSTDGWLTFQSKGVWVEPNINFLNGFAASCNKSLSFLSPLETAVVSWYSFSSYNGDKALSSQIFLPFVQSNTS